MPAAITVSLDDVARRALEDLTSDGASVSTAVREALVWAAAERAKSRLRAEADELADDADDTQILQDMETLRAW